MVSATSAGADQGSEFVIRLPSATADTPLPAVRPMFAGDGAGSAQPKVLIIDDNRDAAESLHALLTDYGFSCASALDGPSGLQAVASFAPDAVLLDLGLPGVDGYEVARQIRSRPGGESHMLIAVTGYGEQRDYEQSAQAGFDAHMVKPVDPDQLLAVLRRIRQPAMAAIAQRQPAIVDRSSATT